MTTTPPEPDQPYGSYPTAPAGGHGAPSAPPQPSSIALAVKLMWAGAVLSLLSLLYSFTTFGGLKDDLREQLMEDDPTVSQSTIDVAYAVGITFAVVFGLLGALLWAWMAWKNGQGRGWARVVATVLAALNLLGVLFSLATASTEPLAAVVSVITLVLAIVILVLLWRKESSAFYEATAASRRPY
jgi:hypothetical protein